VFKTLNRQKQNRTSPHLIIVKTLSILNKEKVLKAAKDKHQVTSKGRPFRITASFSMETLKAKRAWKIVL
jgi:hypothetical protein